MEEERVILLITSGIYNRFNLQRTEMRAGYKTVAVLAKTVTEPQMEDVMTKSLLQCFFFAETCKSHAIKLATKQVSE